MEERTKWTEILAKLISVADELFSGMKGFEEGIITAEVKAELDVKFFVRKESSGAIKAEFSISPKVAAEPTEPETTETETEETEGNVEEIFGEEEKNFF